MQTFNSMSLSILNHKAKSNCVYFQPVGIFDVHTWMYIFSHMKRVCAFGC